MLHKSPKTFGGGTLIGKFVGGFIFVEVGILGASFFFYRKTNSDRDYRYSLKQNHPWFLEKYYSIGEWMDSKNVAIRNQDELVWAVTKKKQE